MNTRQRFPLHPVWIGLLLLALALTPALPAAAQSATHPPEPDYGPALPFWPAGSPQSSDLPDVTAAMSTDISQIEALPPLPSTLTFRYAATLGESGVPYFPDGRLNRPLGLAVSGTDLWVTELQGYRALKYNASGVLVQEIGRVGQNDFYPGLSLRAISDAAVDSAGNLWLADGDAGHVVQFDPSGAPIRSLGRVWNCTGDNDNFCNPSGIAFDSSGRLYVSDGAPWWGSSVDYGNHRIQVFDAQGKYLATIGTTGTAGSGPLQFYGPRRIAIDGTTLYVADSGNHRVQVLNVANPAAPVLLGTLGVAGEKGWDSTHFNYPSGVAVDAQYLYVADSWNNRVQVFRRDTLAYVATLGSGWGSANDQFSTPTDVAVDAAGTIYVADLDNCRVQVFDAQFQYVRTLGVTGEPYRTDERHLNTPWGVAVAGDGSIYVTESLGHRLLKFSASGNALWSIGRAGVQGGWDGEADQLNNPADVAVSGGNVYVADKYNHRIQVFSTAGSYVRTLGVPGEEGDDNAHFRVPNGLGFGPDGALYVADAENHRVQIFDAALNYRATLGVSGVQGSDNAHFIRPTDIVVDSDGTIYVADSGNQRIQVFSAQRQYLRTLGLTGTQSNEFGRFSEPSSLALDKQHRLYVADTWNNRIQVFDQNGVFVTSIGGSASTSPGAMWGPRGVAVDAKGRVYVANTWNNHRIDIYAPGVPDWAQRNINGFGHPRTRGVSSLEVFAGTLYAGTMDHSGTGARRILRLDEGADGPVWTEVVGAAFGRLPNVYVRELTAWGGYLYAGTQNWYPNESRSDGGEIWRSADGETWTPVMTGGFGDTNNYEIANITPYSGTLIASTSNSASGTEVWQSSNGVDWTRVVDNGLDKAANRDAHVMAAFNGYLYAGTTAWDNVADVSRGCEVWRSQTGNDWTQVVTGGLGGLNCTQINALAAFGDHLYAGTWEWDAAKERNPGGRIWRCSAASGCDAKADWQSVIQPGFGNSQNMSIMALVVVDGRLYATTYNYTTGMEVWRSTDGTNWEQVGFAGFGDVQNIYSSWPDNGVLAWEDTLWLGTYNTASGGELWQYQPERAALSIADPSQPQTLTHTRPDGSKLQVKLPAGVLTEPATLVLIGAGGPAAPQGFALVGKTFSLDLVADGQVLPSFIFPNDLKVDVVITYTEAQAKLVDEEQLTLMVWNPTTKLWEDAACGEVVRKPETNQLTVPICHFSRFGVFTPVEQTFLPLIEQ